MKFIYTEQNKKDTRPRTSRSGKKKKAGYGIYVLFKNSLSALVKNWSNPWALSSFKLSSEKNCDHSQTHKNIRRRGGYRVHWQKIDTINNSRTNFSGHKVGTKKWTAFRFEYSCFEGSHFSWEYFKNMKIFLLQNYNGSVSICIEEGKKKKSRYRCMPKCAKRWALAWFSSDNCSLKARGALEWVNNQSKEVHFNKINEQVSMSLGGGGGKVVCLTGRRSKVLKNYSQLICTIKKY